MDSVLDSIRLALVEGATADARATGAAACRAILSALEATTGEPMAASAPAPSTPLAAMVSTLRGMPPEQLLDLAIARLRAALPAGVEVAPIRPLRFHLPSPAKPR